MVGIMLFLVQTHICFFPLTAHLLWLESDAVNKNIDWDDRKSITGFEMTAIESVRYTSDLASRF